MSELDEKHVEAVCAGMHAELHKDGNGPPWPIFTEMDPQQANRIRSLARAAITAYVAKAGDGWLPTREIALIDTVEGWIKQAIRDDLNLKRDEPMPTMALQMKTSAGVRAFMAWAEILEYRAATPKEPTNDR